MEKIRKYIEKPRIFAKKERGTYVKPLCVDKDL
jgi:hypothetical protein